MVPQVRNHVRRELPAMAADAPDSPLIVIEPDRGWRFISLAELWQYRELAYFLTWRDVKVRYRQTLLGAAWAMLQPTLLMLVFSLVFRSAALASANDDSATTVPYPLFAFTGLMAWSYFAAAVSSAAQSVVNAEKLVTKVYFPRLIIPIAAVAAALVDLAMTCPVLFGLLLYYGHSLSWAVILAPLAVVSLTLAAAGMGLGLAALNVRYRDVRHALPFLIQLWLFATPSVYLQPLPSQAASPSAQPVRREQLTRQPPRASSLRWLALNPLDGMVAFFRATLLGGALPWTRLGYSLLVACCALGFGLFYFERVEATFADVL